MVFLFLTPISRYASTPETVSVRDKYRGTWYVQELCEVLEENQYDLVTMVTLVHNQVATNPHYQLPVADKVTGRLLYNYRQQPQMVSTLRHLLYFPKK